MTFGRREDHATFFRGSECTNSPKGGGAAVGASLTTLIFLGSFAAWAKITASSSWRLPAYYMLAVIGFPVAFGLLLLALERWTYRWDEFLEFIIPLMATLAIMVFLAVVR